MPKQIEVLHISAECYPAAKTGGLADVVGALPKYLNQDRINARVVIPKYDLAWINKQTWKEEAYGMRQKQRLRGITQLTKFNYCNREDF